VIALVRVDNRLIHGQVVESWLPTLKVDRVLVADDEAASSPLVRAAMGLAVPSSIEVLIQPLGEMDFARLAADPVKSLLLVREVEGLTVALERGLPPTPINLGNVHFATGRLQVTPSVFLSPQELSRLKMLAERGAAVEARAVPAERPLGLGELEERLSRAG
jgi:PTS system mannose-specific IIB component